MSEPIPFDFDANKRELPDEQPNAECLELHAQAKAIAERIQSEKKKQFVEDLVKQAELDCTRIDKMYHLVVISGQRDKIKRLEQKLAVALSTPTSDTAMLKQFEGMKESLNSINNIAAIHEKPTTNDQTMLLMIYKLSSKAINPTKD